MGFGSDLWSGAKSAGGAVIHGITQPIKDAYHAIVPSGTAPDVSKTPAAVDLSNFSKQLQQEYQNRQGGADAAQARGIQANTIGNLEGVASGKTPTAADALLTKGTDEASRRAMGTAATYSASNPGEALRMGLATGGDLANRAASEAAMQKAKEQAEANAQLVQAANAMRGGDITQDVNLRNATQTALGGAFAPTAMNNTNQMNAKAGQQTFWGNLLSGAGKAFGLGGGGGGGGGGGDIPGAGDTLLPLSSDSRLKTDIHDGSRDADAFLASLAPRNYEWKNPGDTRATGPGEKLGVVAQEMRPQDTREDAGGKFIPPDVISKMLAGMGRLHDRIAAVEEPVKWGPSPYPKEPPAKPIVMKERLG